MTFDPNKISVGEWATYIPGRHPHFKIHATRAHAINAIKYKCYNIIEDSINRECQVKSGIQLYKRGPSGEWIEVPLKKTFCRRGPKEGRNIIEGDAP